jgi:hypothetical protein
MSHPPDSRTLAITLPFGQVLPATILVLAGVLGVGELLARNEAVNALLAPPSITGDDEIGPRLYQLDRQVAASGRPACIIVGSSQAAVGINPDVLSRAYQAGLGRPLPCFNFGISGLDALGGWRLGAALVRLYHPRLLIWGLSFRDFNDNPHSLDIPWALYYQGDWSLEGWLEANSQALRYMLTYRDALRQGAVTVVPAPANGFIARTRSVEPAEALKPDGKVFSLVATWSDHYQILPSELDALKQMVGLNSGEVHIVIVEMPLIPGALAALPNGQTARQTFVDEVRRQTAPKQVPFWLTQDGLDLPPDGWVNVLHLNVRGAEVLSRWIGAQVAAAVRNGALPKLTP